MRAPDSDFRASSWRCRDRRVEWSSTPLVMGILNVTPDSFSDGGRHEQLESAIARARQMLDEGADIIDVGGESTRPGALPVSVEVECARVLPVVQALAASGDTLISIDTHKAEVARQAIAAGARIINDVSAAADAAMADLAAQTGAGLVLMHMRGSSQTMQNDPVYTDVVREVREYLRERAATVQALGVSREQIVIDPGIGFGKTVAHNLKLMADLASLVAEGYPVLVGVSRKRWIGSITGRDVGDRLAGSLAGAMVCAQKGASVLRVHDVAQTRDVLKVMDALRRGA